MKKAGMIILILGIGLAIFASFIASPKDKTVTYQVEMAKEKGVGAFQRDVVGQAG